MINKKNIIGIDLGTTNTVIAKGRKYLYGFGAEVLEIQQFDDTGKNVVFNKVLPSVIYKRKDDDKLECGLFAKEQKIKQPLKTIYNAKRYMGLEHIWEIDNVRFRARDVASEILKVCKMEAEKGFVNKKIDGVTITVPASFTNDQIRDTKIAAEKAGFNTNEINIITEPVAALISYINDVTLQEEMDREINFSIGKRIMVFDIGGGTCDICIVDVIQNGINISLEQKAIGRYEELGGIDFDERAAEYLLNNYINNNSIDPNTINKDELAIITNKLVTFCEKAKEKFSRDIEWATCGKQCNQIVYKYTFENFYDNKDVQFTLTKEEFDEATRSLYFRPRKKSKDSTISNYYKNIEDPIIKTFKEYGVDQNSIDYVFLTGGMSQYSNIRDRVLEILKLDANKAIIASNPMTACAIGAAIYHYYSVDITDIDSGKVGKQKDSKDKVEVETPIYTDKNITSESILIDLAKGLPSIIIKKGTEVPCNGEILDEFVTSSTSGIKLNIYAGDNEYDSRMRIQRSWRGSFDPPVKTGTCVNIYYELDRFKDLKIKIMVLDEIESQTFELSSETDVKYSEVNKNV